MTVPTAAPVRSWRWHLERAAAVLLIVLLPLHLVLAMIVGDPAGWSAVRLSARWEDPVWRVVDWLTLTMALVHGLGALRRRFAVDGAGAGARVGCDVLLVAGMLVAATAALTYSVS